MPDHWHAILVIEACKAGKDIYCQKPLALTIVEGRAMSYAVAKHHVVFQTGSQQRSDYHFRRACELVRNGRIGDLKTVRVGLPGGRPDLAKSADRKGPEPVPQGFEYNTWLGPAPAAPYAPRGATSTSAGSSTIPAARSPTGAGITPTVPSGASVPS